MKSLQSSIKSFSDLQKQTQVLLLSWASAGEGYNLPWILNFQQKGCFLVLSLKKQITPLLPPPWKNFGKMP